MYFYTNKINKNEIRQAQLLEMCCNAGFCVRDGEGFYGTAMLTTVKFI
jgi:hypothetical protein